MQVSQLELGITEATMMANLKDTVAKLHLLVDTGASISIDDFGTGYSSLYYLKALPINTLKIDRSFIKNITTDPNGPQIVETIILMAHNLGIGVVAEGVETKEQLDLLKDFGCDLIQGYYYSPPLPLEELVEYLKTNPQQAGFFIIPP
jgi:EAL domain-containing protein (putative c-di-GMP-specific phosphodiesterase class I)